jgi:hypothetical protein
MPTPALAPHRHRSPQPGTRNTVPRFVIYRQVTARSTPCGCGRRCSPAPSPTGSRRSPESTTDAAGPAGPSPGCNPTPPQRTGQTRHHAETRRRLNLTTHGFGSEPYRVTGCPAICPASRGSALRRNLAASPRTASRGLLAKPDTPIVPMRDAAHIIRNRSANRHCCA